MASRIKEKQSRRAHQAAYFILLSYAVVFLTSHVSPSYAALGDYQNPAQEQRFRQRPMSPFLLRHLEGNLNTSRTFSNAPAARTSASKFATMHWDYPRSSSSFIKSRTGPRRLAGGTNCSTAAPSFCNSTLPGSTCCSFSGFCANLQTDKNNCGICSFICASSLGCCNGTCTSLLTDNKNCGACGKQCTNSLCEAGMCGYGG